MRILLINGPNLNMLGTRQPEIYGTMTLQDIVDRVTRAGEGARRRDRAVPVEPRGRDRRLHPAERAAAPTASSSTPAPSPTTASSLRDAFEAVQKPFVEVHISNIHAREEFRHHSVLADIAVAQVAGLGWRGYIAALDALVGILKDEAS